MPVVIPGWQTARMAPESRDTGAGVAISLFSGAGGLDLGVEQAGVPGPRGRGALPGRHSDHGEELPASLFCRDQVRHPAGPDQGHPSGGGPARPGRPDLLIGGPPCTPFTKSGFWLDWKRAGLDPDASLLQEYTRVLREAQPRRFILENVYALTYNNQASRGAYERLLHEIDDAGYDYRAKVLNAADFGVPQSRPRLFVIGAQKGDPLPDHPDPSHGATGNGA